MVNSSRPLGHMALTEEFDHCNTNTNNNNNNTSFIHEFSIQSDEFFYHNSFQHAVYDTAVFDVLKVEPEDFAVIHIYFSKTKSVITILTFW